MKPTDVRIDSVQVEFSDERLATPLHLSKGTISEITYATVRLVAQTRAGQTATGIGAILLSDLWAFPSPDYSHEQKDAAMRAICRALARRLPANDEFSDPLQKWTVLETLVAQIVQDVAQEHSIAGIPQLAALNCLAPFDSAIHDAWARASERSVYALYTSAYLNQDLSAYLGPLFQNRYPGDFLTPRRHKLSILHVVGAGDTLQAGTEGNDAGTLADWVRRDGLRCFKIKTRGQDPGEDARRIAAVYDTALPFAEGNPIHLSVDPNEACADDRFLLDMLDLLARERPAALQALEYIEQPTGRDLTAYGFTLHRVCERVPVIVDESLDSLETLGALPQQGWSGVALKTCKGQSLSLLAYCWATLHGQFITVQDLTNPGLALVHSANLAANLQVSVDYFECNSRQYMPQARPQEQAQFPAYFAAQDGKLTIRPAGVGLY